MQLSISNLSKTYSNGVTALKNVSLHILVGMFGLLGANGAGKSTLMRTIAGLQEADSGTISFNDIDVLKEKNKIRQILGYLPQEYGLYPKVNAETLLDHFARLKGISDAKQRKEIVDALLQRTNLFDHRKKNLGGYSGGMRQRFGIAQALLGSPQLIIVDEPTAGLDPAERNRFYNLLSEIGENIVVILSSHIIEDIQSLCSNMAIISKGEVLLADSPDKAIDSLKSKIWRKVISKEKLTDYKHLKVISSHLFGGKVEIHVFSDSNPDHFESVEPTLDDVYFATTFNK